MLVVQPLPSIPQLPGNVSAPPIKIEIATPLKNVVWHNSKLYDIIRYQDFEFVRLRCGGSSPY